MKSRTTAKKKTTRRTSSKKTGTATMAEALKESQHMLEIVINNVPQHIFWKDLDSKFLGCNHNFAEAVGLGSPEDIVGKTDFDLTDEDKANYFIEIDKRVIEQNKAIYGMKELHKRANGEEVWLDVNKVPLRNNKGDVIGILGTFEDVTAKIELAQKLEKNAQKYKYLIEQTNTAYVIMDTKLRIIEANKIFANLMDYKSTDNLIGNCPRSWVAHRDIEIFDDAFEALLRGEPINDLELNLSSNEGRSISVTISANIIENGGKKIFCLIRNISQRKMAEKKKYIEEQKKKDRLKQNILEIRGKLRDIRAG